MPKVPDQVIAEQYQLRATFFSNSLDRLGFVGLFDVIFRHISEINDSLSWEQAKNFGVPDETLERLSSQGRKTGVYLCHPNILISNPRYLSYYRCIAALSQKGLKALSGVSSVDKIEKGQECSPEQARKMATKINENLTAIYAVALPEDEKIKGMMYASAGTTIDGSWRNKIGSEGERVVRTLFLKELLRQNEIQNVTMKSGLEVPSGKLSDHWLDENTSELQSSIAKNGSVILFGSEPDIKLISQSGQTVGGVEIKAGIDPAAALERLGAMMKSFDNIRSETSEAETILVASCITDEVDQRLRGMRGVRTFIMTEVIQNRNNQGKRLMNIMRACIGLTDGYQ